MALHHLKKKHKYHLVCNHRTNHRLSRQGKAVHRICSSIEAKLAACSVKKFKTAPKTGKIEKISSNPSTYRAIAIFFVIFWKENRSSIATWTCCSWPQRSCFCWSWTILFSISSNQLIVIGDICERCVFVTITATLIIGARADDSSQVEFPLTVLYLCKN